MTDGFLDLAIVVILATTLGILAKILKQPVILAYLLSGILVGTFSFFHIASGELFRVFADLGIMFLLFLVGLEINYSSLKLVGKTSLILGGCQILFASTAGFFIMQSFGFPIADSAYMGIALAFASTAIVVKMLSDKKELNSLYGKICLGLLLVQDFAAILILIIFSSSTGGDFSWQNIIFAIAKGIGLLLVMFWLGKKIIPRIFDKIAKSQELLFLASLSWCFLIAGIVSKLGFSIEIGGFLAGIALANSSEHFEISGKIKSLRDFFILLFFVVLGSSFIFSNLSGITLPIIAASLFVLIGNPLIILAILGIMGYRRKTGFMCGITASQISEFSFILIVLAAKIGQAQPQSVSIITSAGIISILISTYMVSYSDKIFNKLSKILRIFERKNRIAEPEIESISRPIILIGGSRIGQNIAHHLPKNELLIIDYDPDVIRKLKKSGYLTMFGDIIDEEIFEKADFGKAKLIVSTSAKLADNLLILHIAKSAGKAKVILRAEDEKDAEILYNSCADYVLLPHLTSGQYLGRMISVDPELKIIDQLKKKDLEIINTKS